MQIRVVVHAFTTQFQPIAGREVDSFGKVVALIESGMVSTRKSDDKFSSMLIDPVNWNTGIHQCVGIHDGDQLVEEIRLGLEQFRSSGCHGCFKFHRTAARNTVPGLGLAPVHVVDRVAPVILGVPAERSKAHAHVHPGHLERTNYFVKFVIKIIENT